MGTWIGNDSENFKAVSFQSNIQTETRKLPEVHQCESILIYNKGVVHTTPNYGLKVENNNDSNLSFIRISMSYSMRSNDS